MQKKINEKIARMMDVSAREIRSTIIKLNKEMMRFYEMKIVMIHFSFFIKKENQKKYEKNYE